MYLTEDGFLSYSDFNFLNFDNVSDLSVSLNDQSIPFNVSQCSGKKYYAISGFNITGKDAITKLKISFEIERTPKASKLTNIPWMFLEGYATIVHLPTTNIAVQRGNISDLSALQVRLDVKNYRILTENSGWVDLVVPPKDEWTRYLVDGDRVNLPRFEYSIDQEKTSESDLYLFKTRFSESNIASRIALVMVPECALVFLPYFFFLSPLYVPLASILHRSKPSAKGKIRRRILLLCAIYSAPLIYLAGIYATLFDFRIDLSVLSWLATSTNPLLLSVAIMYPAVFFVTFSRWQESIKQSTARAHSQ
jgi:hypothetical protein